MFSSRYVTQHVVLMTTIWSYSEDSHLACAQETCKAGHWKCKDGLRCMDESRVCDGYSVPWEECYDRSDEDPSMCAKWNCTAGYWKCHNVSQCIVETWRCDRESDCKDSSDEDTVMCAQRKCPNGHWKCQDGFKYLSSEFFATFQIILVGW